MQEVLEKHVSEFYVNQNERQSFVSILEKNGFCKNFELNLKKKDGTPMIASLSVTETPPRKSGGKKIVHGGDLEGEK